MPGNFLRHLFYIRIRRGGDSDFIKRIEGARKEEIVVAKGRTGEKQARNVNSDTTVCLASVGSVGYCY